MYRCDCGRFEFAVFELDGKKYCPGCAPPCDHCGKAVGDGRAYFYRGKFWHENCYEIVRPRCHVCGLVIDDQFFETSWGNLCKKCYNPQNACFTCNRQLLPDKALRLADYRVSCPTCAATAVYRVDKSLVLEIKRYLRWFPDQHITFGTVDLARLYELRLPINGTALGSCLTLMQGARSGLRAVNHRIMILFGLPHEICMATLVHELFHAWLHENVPINRYAEAETEWLCEQMALNFLQAIRAQDHWLKKVKTSRDRYPKISGLKSRGQDTIVRSLLR